MVLHITWSCKSDYWIHMTIILENLKSMYTAELRKVTNWKTWNAILGVLGTKFRTITCTQQQVLINEGHCQSVSFAVKTHCSCLKCTKSLQNHCSAWVPLTAFKLQCKRNQHTFLISSSQSLNSKSGTWIWMLFPHEFFCKRECNLLWFS